MNVFTGVVHSYANYVVNLFINPLCNHLNYTWDICRCLMLDVRKPRLQRNAFILFLRHGKRHFKKTSETWEQIRRHKWSRYIQRNVYYLIWKGEKAIIDAFKSLSKGKKGDRRLKNEGHKEDMILRRHSTTINSYYV